MTILLIILLLMPTVWALWDDRNGDVHPNNDLLMIGLLIVVFSIVVAAVDPLTTFRFDLIRCLVLSSALYITLFPYAVNYMMQRRGIYYSRIKWYSHLSKTAWPDKLPLWSGTPWFVRMFVLFIILSIALDRKSVV